MFFFFSKWLVTFTKLKCSLNNKYKIKCFYFNIFLRCTGLTMSSKFLQAKRYVFIKSTTKTDVFIKMHNAKVTIVWCGVRKMIFAHQHLYGLLEKILLYWLSLL